jgi:xanthine dehydrogenase YagS FAD-binding subunit
MKRFAYANASTVEQAVQALEDGRRPMAGGTDLIGRMKRGLAAPERLVNLKTIDGLRGIERVEGEWRVGALTTLSELAGLEAPAAREELALLSQAAEESASPQLRHAATIGGNLVQRPRCWYFRNPLIHCWLKGGDHCFAASGKNACHAILGAGTCHIVHPSDPAVALLALDARVEVAGPGGRRQVKLADLYAKPRRGARGETMLGVDELVTGLVVPASPAGARGAFVKVAERQAWDFALVSAAAQLSFGGEAVVGARVVLGGVAAMPWRARQAEDALVGGPLSPERMTAAASASTAGAAPLSENGYKVRLVQGVIREALRPLAGEAAPQVGNGRTVATSSG